MNLALLLAQSPSKGGAAGEPMVERAKLRAAVLGEQGDVVPPSGATTEAWDTQIRAIRAPEVLPASSDPEAIAGDEGQDRQVRRLGHEPVRQATG